MTRHWVLGVTAALLGVVGLGPVSSGALGVSAATVAPAQRVKIMPLGDSITFGFPDRTYGGYRHLLGTLLKNDGYDVEFVGSMASGQGVIPNPANEGHVGWTIQQVKDGIDTKRWLEKYEPDIVLLHIGTNDLRRRLGPSAREHLSALLDDILTRLPQAHIVVAHIIAFRAGPDPSHGEYNATLSDVVKSKGPRLSLVDFYTLLTKADYADGIHPNSGGYDKMALGWEHAVVAILSHGAGQPEE
jgi:lysophospholipase L1-like esterase